MHIRPFGMDEKNLSPKTDTFKDAIAKYGHILKQADLAEAYRRVGTSLKGQIE
jgi:hypothetical protein